MMKYLFMVLSVLVLSATAHAAEERFYFQDLEGGCHWAYRDKIADPKEIHDADEDECDGSYGRFIGQNHVGKRDGQCAEITPRSTLYKVIAKSLCEEMSLFYFDDRQLLPLNVEVE